MENVISKLVHRFENGRLTRRELVQALALLTLSGRTARAQGLSVRTVDHASVLVSDMARSVEFYQRVFDLSVVSEDADNEIVRLGVDNRVLVSLRHEATPGVIDHFALGVDGFDQEGTTRELQARGVTPEPVNIDFGFHFKDPDGAIVQLVEARESP
jgi:catechol 2,3-dioxygenase-like lactoylglutathione lyase family enzyme